MAKKKAPEPELQDVAGEEQEAVAYVVPAEYGDPKKIELEIYYHTTKKEYLIRVIHTDTDRIDSMGSKEEFVNENFGMFMENIIKKSFQSDE